MKGRKNRLGLIVAVALGVAVAVPAVSQARTLYGTTSGGKLISFSDKAKKVTGGNTDGKKGKSPKVVQATTSRNIVGLPTGVSLVGIDFRPKTGELYGIGSNSVPYQLLLVESKSARALPISLPFAPGLVGSRFGVDFNPVPDAIRIVSDANIDYRVSPITGAHGAGSPDMPLNPGSPSIVGAGYSNSSFNNVQPVGAVTTLFTVDSTTNVLNTQGSPSGAPTSPNTGFQFGVGSLGIDIGTTVGFDVVGSFGGPSGLLSNAEDGKTTLYGVNLSNGQTNKVGDVVTVNKKGRVKATTLTGLAAVQD